MRRIGDGQDSMISPHSTETVIHQLQTCRLKFVSEVKQTAASRAFQQVGKVNGLQTINTLQALNPRESHCLTLVLAFNIMFDCHYEKDKRAASRNSTGPSL